MSWILFSKVEDTTPPGRSISVNLNRDTMVTIVHSRTPQTLTCLKTYKCLCFNKDGYEGVRTRKQSFVDTLIEEDLVCGSFLFVTCSYWKLINNNTHHLSKFDVRSLISPKKSKVFLHHKDTSCVCLPDSKPWGDSCLLVVHHETPGTRDLVTL